MLQSNRHQVSYTLDLCSGAIYQVLVEPSPQVLQFTWSNDFIYKGRCNSTLPKEIFLRDHPFKMLAKFSQFLTPTPLPAAVFTTIRRQMFDSSPLKNTDVLIG